ncbi:hypothetical protein CSUI_007435 [Cystoisospora suis]|uniref:Transmembrane protein n=1 Tax=Cystoisospora suis TaxID=483139 RepID=A0A2C6KNP8_9APIC|nr:hypothetical protein CSUI_007435 [Cystoisospora suis]
MEFTVSMTPTAALRGSPSPNKLLVGFLVLVLIGSSSAFSLRGGRNERQVTAKESINRVTRGGVPIKKGTYDDNGTNVVLVGRDWTAANGVRKQSDTFAEFPYGGTNYRLYLSKGTETVLSRDKENLKALQASLESIPYVGETPEGDVAVVWSEEGFTQNIRLPEAKIQNGVKYEIRVKPEVLEAFFPEDIVYQPWRKQEILQSPREMEGDKRQGWQDLQDLLTAFLEFATSPSDALQECERTSPHGEWYHPRPNPSDREIAVGDFYGMFLDKKDLMPPLHRYTDSRGVASWVIGRHWRHSLESMGRSFKDGQAFVRFPLGSTMRFEIVLPKKVQKVLQSHKLLDLLVEALSEPPSMPEPLASTKTRGVNAAGKVVYWGKQIPPEENYKTWDDKHTTYRVRVPKTVEITLNAERVWDDLELVLVRSVLAIAEAQLNLYHHAPTKSPTSA